MGEEKRRQAVRPDRLEGRKNWSRKTRGGDREAAEQTIAAAIGRGLPLEVLRAGVSGNDLP